MTEHCAALCACILLHVCCNSNTRQPSEIRTYVLYKPHVIVAKYFRETHPHKLEMLQIKRQWGNSSACVSCTHLSVPCSLHCSCRLSLGHLKQHLSYIKSQKRGKKHYKHRSYTASLFLFFKQTVFMSQHVWQ